MADHIIELVDVGKDYGGSEALRSINIRVRSKEFLTLLGPSGCGKTTTLRIIAGFENPTRGKVLFNGQDITGVPPYLRRVNTVFQRYALFPHLNVMENVAFGLRIKKMDREQTAGKVAQMLEMVNLSGYERRNVSSLSGGEQQRVAIARALVNEPEVLLLDEPLGALDLKLRKEMQIELKNMQQRLGITFVYVTHDQEEALTMSDTIVVMDSGVIQQTGTPVNIYNEPSNAFVADFIGESNIVPGVMLRDYLVKFAGAPFECVDAGFAPDEPVDVVIRPEDVKIIGEDEARIRGIVRSVTFKGVHYEMIVETGTRAWIIHSTTRVEAQSRVGLEVLPNDIHIMHGGGRTG
ncbi:MAG TPA: spermidine/putrescine ABC transporter ATP-binding protein [Clostridiales bacterium]|nr:spermidine/putrescine ABC transporter ATP-binding protein [Clostridiales bacterium]